MSSVIRLSVGHGGDDVHNKQLLSFILDPILKSDSDLLVVSVYGVRNEIKSVLLNYVTQYLTWLSSQNDDQGMIFATEEGVGTQGVVLKLPAFQTPVQNSPGSEAQVVPVILVDVSRNSDVTSGTCVQIIRLKVSSASEFLSKLVLMERDWERESKWNREHEDLLFLMREWTVADSHHRSVQWFEFPDTKETACQFLQALIYEAFGGVCGSDETSALVQQQQIIETTVTRSSDAVVEKEVTNYVLKFANQFSDTSASNSLVRLHNKSLTESVANIKSVKSPAQVTLTRINILNNRVNQEFEHIRKRHSILNNRLMKRMVIGLSTVYKDRMDEVVKKKKVLEDQDLQTLHLKEMSKCLTLFRNKKFGVGESQLMDNINSLFEDIRNKNSETRAKIEAEAKSLIESHLKPFEEQMKTSLSQMVDLNPDQVDNRFANLKAKGLQKFDVAIKSLGLNPGNVRKRKMEFDHELESKKKKLVTEREMYVKDMENRVQQMLERVEKEVSEQMRTNIFMPEEEIRKACAKRIRNIPIRTLDDVFLSRFHSQSKEIFDQQWMKLQTTIEKLEEKVESLVDKSFDWYKRDMDAVVQTKDKRPPSLTQLTARHEKLSNHIKKEFQKNKFVVAVSPDRPEFEEKLAKKMSDYFKSIIPLFRKLIEEDIQQLVKKSIDSYNQSMDGDIALSPPETADALTQMHNWVSKRLLSHLESEPKVQESREKDQILQQLKSALDHELEERKNGLEQEIERREAEKEMDDAVREAADFFKERTTAKLMTMTNITEAQFEKLTHDYRKKAFELFDMRLKELDVGEGEDHVSKLEAEMDEHYISILLPLAKERMKSLTGSIIDFMANTPAKVMTGGFNLIKKLISPVASSGKETEVSSSSKSLSSTAGSEDDVVKAAAKTFVREFREYLAKNPGATGNARLKAKGRFANKVAADLRRRGFGKEVIESAKSAMASQWNRMKLPNYK